MQDFFTPKLNIRLILGLNKHTQILAVTERFSLYRDLDTFCRYFVIFATGDNFCDFLFTFRTSRRPFEERSTLKGKDVLPQGANFQTE